jgi:hypothetical protein
MTPQVVPMVTRKTPPAAPQRAPGSTKVAAPAPRQVQVLQSGRAPAQLSLLLRPVR